MASGKVSTAHPSLGLGIATVLAGFGAGALVVALPAARLPLLIGVGASAGWIIGRKRAWWALLVLTLGGALVLGYGFANIGIGLSTVPVPAAELSLAVLLGWMAASRDRALPSGVVPWLVAAFLGWSVLRLMVDLGPWGRDAIRDFTLPLEVMYLFVGYYAMRVVGLRPWVRALSCIFLICLPYFALYPMQASLAQFGPEVGLQRPVPLLGSYPGAATAGTAAFLFFVVVKPWGKWSYIIATLFLPVLAVLQSRGVYLAIPLAMFSLFLMSGKGARETRRSLVVVVVFGALIMSCVFFLAPSGRLGPITPEFVQAQLATLTGGSGPGQGSLSDRLRWSESIFAQVTADTRTVFLGLGLGPDLTQGFVAGNDVLVRKPHNDYLEVFARLGLVGLALFFALLVCVLVRIWRATRKASGARSRFLRWSLASSIVYLFIAATQPLLAFPYGTIPLFCFCGAALALVDDASILET